MATPLLNTTTASSRAVKLWQHMTSPPDSITDESQRLRVQLLSSLLLLITPVAILAGVTVPFATHPDAPWQSATFIAAFTAMFAFIAAYVLNRSGHYDAAAWIMILTFLFAPYTAVILDDTANSINRAFINILDGGVLLTSILFSQRRPLVLTFVAGLIGILLYPVLIRENDFSLVFAPLVAFLALSVLTFLYNDHRGRQEKIRQQELVSALSKAEIANTSLIEANNIAREATRLKSEFMASMSHELRTPLHAVIGFSGVLLEGFGGTIDEKAQHMIERIDANSTRLLGLINDILDIAKIEAGRMDLVTVPMRPAKLAEEWRSQMSILAEAKGLSFAVEIDPAVPTQLYGDPERISQIATNLLSNAFKFTEKGTVKLALMCDKSTWQIQVTDSGIGIPPHALNFIFDEFRQVDGSSRRSFGGSGLGLAIVRNLCRMMGGNIRVISTLGQGSTFTVTLPLHTTLPVQTF